MFHDAALEMTDSGTVTQGFKYKIIDYMAGLIQSN